MDVKQKANLTLKLVLTFVVIIAYFFITNSLEYRSQFKSIDNPTGAATLLLLTIIAILLNILIWKRYKNCETSTIVFTALIVFFSLLLIPAWTGNWYPLAKMPEPDLTSPDLSVYAPFKENTQAAKLSSAASTTISDQLPTLDGATALYPVYAAFANAVYNEGAFTSETVQCTKTVNAYKRIIEGDCDIIFVAGASDTQKQAAREAGSELAFTPIGKEAFVFLAGKSNPINELSYQQLKNIYTGKTAYWKTLGWNTKEKIIAFQRPEGSGSQTGLQNLMRGLPLQKPQPLPDNSLIGTGSMLKQVSVEYNGIQPALGYSYRYYATTMYPNPDSKLLSINGVYPSNETISDGSYPFSSSFFAVTNGAPKGNVKTLIDWILSPEGQVLIEKTGYASLE